MDFAPHRTVRVRGRRRHGRPRRWRPRQPGGADGHRRTVGGVAHRRRRRRHPRRDQRTGACRRRRTPTCRGWARRSPGCACSTTDPRVFNVGDSPVFSITDGVLQQISIDDSVFDTNGRPTNIITQSLGQFPPVQPHLEVRPLEAGTYLLCSDGVSGVMSPEELREAVKQPDLDEVAATSSRPPAQRCPRQLLVPHRRDSGTAVGGLV